MASFVFMRRYIFVCSCVCVSTLKTRGIYGRISLEATHSHSRTHWSRYFSVPHSSRMEEAFNDVVLSPSDRQRRLALRYGLSSQELDWRRQDQIRGNGDRPIDDGEDKGNASDASPLSLRSASRTPSGTSPSLSPFHGAVGLCLNALLNAHVDNDDVESTLRPRNLNREFGSLKDHHEDTPDNDNEDDVPSEEGRSRETKKLLQRLREARKRYDALEKRLESTEMRLVLEKLKGLVRKRSRSREQRRLDPPRRRSARWRYFHEREVDSYPYEWMRKVFRNASSKDDASPPSSSTKKTTTTTTPSGTSAESEQKRSPGESGVLFFHRNL